MTDPKLLIAAMTGLIPELDTLNRYHAKQPQTTFTSGKRPVGALPYSKQLDAKRREIAEWNERVKK